MENLALWIIGGFVLLVLLLIFYLANRVNELIADLKDVEQRLQERRKDCYYMQDQIWSLDKRLNELGQATGHIYVHREAHQAWEKQS